MIDEESIDSMHEYLIKEGQVKNRPDLLFLGEIYHGFLPRMEHLVNFFFTEKEKIHIKNLTLRLFFFCYRVVLYQEC